MSGQTKTEGRAMTISAADIAVKTEWKIPLDQWERLPDEERAYYRDNVAHARNDHR